MTDRTWVGGGNNKASNPNDWSPTGAPQPGDGLSMSAGTMNISDGDLRGDALGINTIGILGTPTLNLSHHSDATVFVIGSATLNLSRHAHATVTVAPVSIPPNVTVNVRGTASLDLSAASRGALGLVATVNLADHAALIGNFHLDHRDLTISGDDDTALIHNGTSSITASRTTIDPNVLGHGTFAVSSFSTSPEPVLGILEFGGIVSAGQTIELIGGLGLPQTGDATLKVDDPKPAEPEPISLM